MTYLTAEQVLFLHDRLIPDPMTKAAVLMDGLVRNHPFVDGNKRTGIATAALFLQMNGYRLTVTNQELEAFALHVTASKPVLAEIAEWFRTNTTRTRRR